MIVGIGIVVVLCFVIFVIRQYDVASDFLDEHRERINRENDAIAKKWRASNPKEDHLLVEREFEPPVFFPPIIWIKKRYRR